MFGDVLFEAEGLICGIQGYEGLFVQMSSSTSHIRLNIPGSHYCRKYNFRLLMPLDSLVSSSGIIEGSTEKTEELHGIQLPNGSILYPLKRITQPYKYVSCDSRDYQHYVETITYNIYILGYGIGMQVLHYGETGLGPMIGYVCN